MPVFDSTMYSLLVVNVEYVAGIFYSCTEFFELFSFPFATSYILLFSIFTIVFFSVLLIYYLTRVGTGLCSLSSLCSAISQ